MNQLRMLQHTGVISSLFHITMIDNSALDSQPEVQIEIQQLLGDFESILQSLNPYHHTCN